MITTQRAVDLSSSPHPLLVDALGIAGGAMTLVAGYGYSRKTLAMQDLAVSVATGMPLWGVHPVRRGRALHLDYEQGVRTTRERYDRIADARGTSLAELGDFLHVSVLPATYLDDDSGADDLVRACEGFGVVIIDSLRASCPRSDEAGGMRKVRNALCRASASTGAAVVVVHHVGRPSPPAADTSPNGLRGSSALFDMSSSVFEFDGRKGSPTRVRHLKDRARGAIVPDFEIDTEDLGAGGHGLRVVCRPVAVMASAPSMTVGEAAQLAAFDGNRERILGLLRTRAHRKFRGTKEAFREKVQLGAPAFRAALATLIDDGKVVKLDNGWQLAGLS